MKPSHHRWDTSFSTVVAETSTGRFKAYWLGTHNEHADEYFGSNTRLATIANQPHKGWYNVSMALDYCKWAEYQQVENRPWFKREALRLQHLIGTHGSSFGDRIRWDTYL